MKLQTEFIEKQQARLTIEVEPEKFADAKRKAARKISRQVNIRGFRKGKAPYRLVAQHVGEAAIYEEALEDLGDTVYKWALEETDAEPFSGGTLEDFSEEPVPTFVFTIPLKPEVDLKNYEDIRLDFEAPTVTEEALDQALQELRQEAIKVVDDSVPVTALGNRVRLRVESEFVDGEERDENEEEDEEDDDYDESVPYIPKKGDVYMHSENSVVILDPDNEPFLVGFVENMLDVELGSDVEFELTVPDGGEDDIISNRRVYFLVTVEHIEAIEVPELDDDFARETCRRLGEPEMDLAGLRQTLRENMQRDEVDEAESEYSSKVLDAICESAEVKYPDMMLELEIDGMIEKLQGNLQQQGIKLADYMRLTNTSPEGLRESFREQGAASLHRMLVKYHLIELRGIKVSDDDVDLSLDYTIEGLGGGKLREMFNAETMRESMYFTLLNDKINKHLVAMGRGEDADEAVARYLAQTRQDTKELKAKNERRKQYQEEDEQAEQAALDAAEQDSGADA